MTFREVVSAVVLFTRGTLKERSQFLFHVYGGNDEATISTEDIEQLLLRSERPMDDGLARSLAAFPDVDLARFQDLVRMHPRATSLFAWANLPPRVFPQSDPSAPTYFETLAEVSEGAFTEAEVADLEKGYSRARYRGANYSGVFDQLAFAKTVGPILTPALAQHVFRAMDADADGSLSLRELVCAMARCCRGPPQVRLAFCFEVFDTGRAGRLDVEEVAGMLAALDELERPPARLVSQVSVEESTVAAAALGPGSLEAPAATKVDCEPFSSALRVSATIRSAAEAVMTQYAVMSPALLLPATITTTTTSSAMPGAAAKSAVEGEGAGEGEGGGKGEDEGDHQRRRQQQREQQCLSLEGFSAWATRTGAVDRLQEALTQAAHLHLGLRPASVREEARIINAYLRRLPANQAGSGGGPGDDVVYLISSQWWQGWQQRASGANPAASRGASPANGKADVSGEEMGPIDNLALVRSPGMFEKTVYSRWGPRVKRSIVAGRDFTVLTEPVWQALHQWYGGGPALARPTMRDASNRLDLELHPLSLKVMRHTHTAATRSLDEESAAPASGKGVPDKPQVSFFFFTDCSRHQTIGQVVAYVCREQKRLPKGLGRISPENARLWDYRNHDRPMLLDEG